MENSSEGGVTFPLCRAKLPTDKGRYFWVLTIISFTLKAESIFIEKGRMRILFKDAIQGKER